MTKLFPPNRSRLKSILSCKLSGNNIYHTVWDSSDLLARGEAFRRQRNRQGGRVRAPSLAQGPSLPPLATNETEDEDFNQEAKPVSFPKDKTAGPRPPRSWALSNQSSSKASWQWRSHALSLIFRHTPSPSPALYLCTASRIPSLFQLCMHTLVYEFGGIPPELFPSLPRHILREYVRYCAAHAPSLPREDLDALWAVDNATSADGELIITGPFAESVLYRISESLRIVPSDWESDSTETEASPLLHTFIVLSSSFQPSLIPLLPPTLTHLALLDIPKIPLHILPPLLPLLAVLDLSFNAWLGAQGSKFSRLEWSKWTKLELLGLRGCAIGDADMWTLKKTINQGRLTDVEIILEV